MDITLNFTTLYGIVERSLSIIGKRSVDDQGNFLFKDITLGSRETEIVNDYFRQAIIDLSAETAAFITASTDNSITLTFPGNHNSALNSFIQKSCEAYCTSYALHSWLNITAPRIADKYGADCNRQLAVVIRLLHEKKAPTSESSPIDVTTDVS